VTTADPCLIATPANVRATDRSLGPAFLADALAVAARHGDRGATGALALKIGGRFFHALSPRPDDEESMTSGHAEGR